MNKWCLNLAFFLFALPSLARAAANVIPPPSAPYLQTPAPGSHWSVDIDLPAEIKVAIQNKSERKPGESAVPIPSLPVRLQVSFGRNKMMQGEIIHSDGRKIIFYLADGQILQKGDNTDEIAVFSVNATPGDSQNLRVFPFPALGWMNQARYESPDKANNAECYRFILPSEVKRNLELEEGTEVRAWIRIRDGFPAMVKVGETTLHFSEVTPFPRDVELPPAYQKAYDKMRAQQMASQNLRLH